MKKILITGATGFIGRNLIERLKRNGGGGNNRCRQKLAKFRHG